MYGVGREYMNKGRRRLRRGDKGESKFSCRRGVGEKRLKGLGLRLNFNCVLFSHPLHINICVLTIFV